MKSELTESDSLRVICWSGWLAGAISDEWSVIQGEGVVGGTTGGKGTSGLIMGSPPPKWYWLQVLLKPYVPKWIEGNNISLEVEKWKSQPQESRAGLLPARGLTLITRRQYQIAF